MKSCSCKDNLALKHIIKGFTAQKYSGIDHSPLGEEKYSRTSHEHVSPGFFGATERKEALAQRRWSRIIQPGDVCDGGLADVSSGSLKTLKVNVEVLNVRKRHRAPAALKDTLGSHPSQFG